MRTRETSILVILALITLGRFADPLLAEDPPAPQTEVGRWYAADPSRVPKCQVDVRIRKVYPDIDVTLAALKFALSDDKGWQGVTWKHDEDLAEVRRGMVEALDDPNMMFGWKPNNMPMHMIKKGVTFNDAVTKNGTLIEFERHAFNHGNDQEQISARASSEVMRTLSHELGHVWDCRAHTITKYSVEFGGKGLCYDFQTLVPDSPFSPAALREIRRALGMPGAENETNSKGEKFYIYAVNTSGWSLYVGVPAEVEHRAGRSITDGGPGDDPVEFKKLGDKEFDTKADGLAYLKTKVTLGKHSVWTGQFVFYDGTEYRTVHVPEVLK